MSKIAVVVGHSETDPGAVNDNGRTEFQYNSELAPLVCEALIELGHEPLIVWRDRSYSKMPARVNSLGIDFSIELHCNAFNGKASGSEVLHHGSSVKGARLANSVLNEIVNVLGLPDRGVKGISSKDRGGLMVAYTMKPHVIIEPFFIDNLSDLGIGETCKAELATAIAVGCDEYVKGG